MYPFGSLPENLAAFCAVLRHEHGFRIGPGELRDATRALDIVDVLDEQAVRDALRAVLSSSHADAFVFDKAFTAFFYPGPAGIRQDHLPSARLELGSGAEGREVDASRLRHAPPPGPEADDAAEPGVGAMTPVSDDSDRLEEASLFAPSSYSPVESEAAEALELPRVDAAWREGARTLLRRLHWGLSRRWRPAPRGRRFDLRRTLRASLQTGGETLAPRWLHRPRVSPRLVLLVDGSRSMSGHTRAALSIAVAIVSATLRVEVFTFSTELRRITSDARRAARGQPRRLDDMHRAWAGGTSIGGSLRDFLRRFGERTLGRDTIVVIASDGLDVGSAVTLRDAMRELHRRAAGVVWLNPLLETAGYEPTASGMRAARPFVDTFASANDAAAFARLARSVRLRA